MATTTPNFGWSVPTSTDLVKDGATAIETLGDSIDASLVDLKGGTSGQVLAKNSGTDMDFVWVTTDDTNAIQNAIVDAKGDLIAATAADTPARLAVGTNGQVLTADSTAATGLAWATATSGGMTLLSTTSLSGTSTSITSIDQTYVDLVIRIEAAQVTGSGGINCTLNSNTGSVYQRVILAGSGGTATTSSATAAQFFPYTSGMPTTATDSFIEIIIPSYTNATNKVLKMYTTINDGSTQNVLMQATAFLNSTAVSSIQVNTNATGWAAGSVKIYGVK